MKKTLRFTFLIAASLILAGCELPDKNNDLTPNIIAKDTIALQATTALTLVDGFSESSSLQQLGQEFIITDEQDPAIPIATLDFFLNNDTAFHIEKTISDREGYDYLDIISFNISIDFKTSYALYYNLETSDVEINDNEEIVLSGNNKQQSQGEANRNGNNHNHGAGNQDRQQDGNGNGAGNRHNHGNGNKGFGKGKHNHYRISGLALVDGNEYRFIAKTENKNNGEETETALKFRLYKDEQNYIVIKHETELLEITDGVEQQYGEKFSYVVVENNEVTQQFKHELVKAGDEFVLSVKIAGTKYIVESFTSDEKVYLQVTLCDGQTVIYEKIVTTDLETGITTVLYVLQ